MPSYCRRGLSVLLVCGCAAQALTMDTAWGGEHPRRLVEKADAGTVAIPRVEGIGLRADLSDDHPAWSGDGTAGLAFWYAPPEHLPAMKFMYDYLCGDTNTFRILGLGGCWIVGGGRTADPSGQTNLFAGPPRKPPKGKGQGLGLGKLESCNFTADGGGVAVTSGSCLDVQDHRRAFAADYSGRSGSPAMFLVAETSQNGRLWRLNTPEFNEVSAQANTFTLRGPTGATLVAAVIKPPTVAFRQGTLERGGDQHVGYPYRGTKYIRNKWIEFDCNASVVVVMTLQAKGQVAPKVTGSGTAKNASLHIGKLEVRIDAEGISLVK